MSSVDSYEVMRKSKNWHHDIKKIDGEWIEAIVQKYQKSMDEKEKESLLGKVIENYAIFRPGWAKAFAPYLDNDPEAGALMHDEIIWRSANNFNREKTRKVDGKAFNAYLVSGLLNSLKNYHNTRMSHKNHPRVKCPICEEEVYQIDAKHLRHKMDLDRYRKTFPSHPTTSRDGMAACPETGERVREAKVPSPVRLAGVYSLADFYCEFPELCPPRDLACPVTGMPVRRPTREYPPTIKAGYTEREFISDFPGFAGIIKCPFSGRRMLHPTQQYLDDVMKRHGGKVREASGRRARKAKGAIEDGSLGRVRPVLVYNPYSEAYVDEITMEMLRAAGTTVMEHLEKHATILLDKYYPDMISCPFTGRRTFTMTKGDLEKIGKTPHDFYQATCKYPLRRWQVTCAMCGQWVDNIWEHLASQEHNYAPVMSQEDFERSYGTGNVKLHVTTNCFVEGESGDSTHIADLLATTGGGLGDAVDIEDSLLGAARDEMDRKIVRALRAAATVDDVACLSSEKVVVTLPACLQSGQTKAVRSAVKAAAKLGNFDIWPADRHTEAPKPGDSRVVVMIPGRDVIKERLARMIEASDLPAAGAVTAFKARERERARKVAQGKADALAKALARARARARELQPAGS